jgi:hypothetical protein
MLKTITNIITKLTSNSSTGVLQVTGPANGTTRVMTVPDASFTVARTDAAQSFSGLQTFDSGVSVTSGKVTSVYNAGGDFVAVFQNTTSGTPYNVWIKDAATPTAGYPLLTITNDNASTAYFKVNSSTGNTELSSLGTGIVYSNASTLTSTNPSDKKLKDNITPILWGLSEINKLNPVSYTWKSDLINQGKQYGFIAQEVQLVMPELVKTFKDNDGKEFFGLEKDGIYATLVKAIQEQQLLITRLQADVASIKKA